MKSPIPLGGIAIRRLIDKEVSFRVEKLIRKRIEYAFSNYPLITDYVKQHSQEMSEEVMRQHIELYVNNFSIDLGRDGKNAIETLYKIASAKSQASSVESSSVLFLS